MKEYYEEFWSRPEPPPIKDELTPVRASILWQQFEQDGITPRRLLDVGAGDGALVQAAQKRGIEAIGMDISEIAIDLARRSHPGCTFVCGAAEARPWPVAPGTVDVVVAFEVIAHLVRPAELVLGAAEVLQRGGHLAVTTPYHGLLKNLALLAHGFERHFNVEGDHLRFFTDRSLKGLLHAHGFSLVRTVHFGRFPGLSAGSFIWAVKR